MNVIFNDKASVQCGVEPPCEGYICDDDDPDGDVNRLVKRMRWTTSSVATLTTSTTTSARKKRRWEHADTPIDDTFVKRHKSRLHTYHVTLQDEFPHVWYLLVRGWLDQPSTESSSTESTDDDGVVPHPHAIAVYLRVFLHMNDVEFSSDMTVDQQERHLVRLIGVLREQRTWYEARRIMF